MGCRMLVTGFFSVDERFDKPHGPGSKSVGREDSVCKDSERGHAE